MARHAMRDMRRITRIGVSIYSHKRDARLRDLTLSANNEQQTMQAVFASIISSTEEKYRIKYKYKATFSFSLVCSIKKS